ncbi:MAG: helix-hairpin-helix domain-containing protein, partial [Promethearchaeota archaeon]
MTSIMRVANSIGKSTAERMRDIGIDSIEKLASSSIEKLLAIEGISVSDAKNYIQFAKNHIERIKAKGKIFDMINKKITPNASRSGNISNNSKQFNKKNTPRVPISSIKKLASSSIEDLSKLKGMNPSNAQKYIEIAKKYLENMRKEEKFVKVSSSEPKKQNQLLNFVKFDGKKYPKNLKTEIQLKQKEDSSLKKPRLEIKSIKTTTNTKNVRPKPVKVERRKQPDMKTFFPPSTLQKIRFLHYKIKKLEEVLSKNESFAFSELNNVLEYIKILNVNYKTQSQIKIFKELDITSSFHDPLARKEIKIWDLIFECSRVLWIAAQAYSYLSTKFEAENLMENAIVAMVECSKMYKTAAYFSAACTRQEDKGIALSVENLELNSEESRILAQNLATINEEKKGNFAMASKLSAGLSALTKRLTFLREYDHKRDCQFRAQTNYDIGRSCNFQAKSLQLTSPEGESEDKIENLQKKANYYYIKAEEIWESLLNKSEGLTDPEKEGIRSNLSIVNDNIIENDVEIIYDEEALKIQDPEPLIIIPENLAPFIPRTTNFLTKYKQADLNYDAYLRYKNLMSDVLINYDKVDELKNSKAGIGRTLKQLKILYDNNDIDINNFTELYEKYSIKLEAIEYAIQNLKNPGNN